MSCTILILCEIWALLIVVILSSKPGVVDNTVNPNFLYSSLILLRVK